MGTVFTSGNLGEIEEFLSAGYASTKLNVINSHEPRLFQATRNSLGPISVDRMRIDLDLEFVTDPLGTIGVVLVESGVFRYVLTEKGASGYAEGDVFFTAQPDRPYAGRVDRGSFSYAALAPDLLSQVAATAPVSAEAPVRLTDYHPVSPAAAQRLRRTIVFLRDHVLTNTAIRDSPLIASTAPQLLAATVLSTFPNTALTEPTVADRHDGHPRTLRRAVSFIDDHAQRDISVADIAAAVHVTVRALQYAFRRYYGTTPMGYLRQVRLYHAHRELLAADPTSGVTVTEVAARWGFFHPGRFAEYYRTAFGRPPYQTLQKITDSGRR